jgi:hypothetical protein
MKTKLFFLSVIVSLVIVSCSNEKENEESIEVKDTTATKVQENAPSVMLLSNDETYFQVPSPGEVLAFLKTISNKENKNISSLNQVDNLKKYTDEKSKALNFGIYSTDLSYCSIFNMGMETIKYFKVVKQLGDQLGLSSILTPDLISRIEKNIDNSDSLRKITDKMFFSSYELLEDSKQGHTLALFLTGSWIESMYIALNMVSNYQEKDPIVQKIYEQKKTLQNIIEFLKKYESQSEDVKQIKEPIINLLNAYNLPDDKNTKTKKQKNVDSNYFNEKSFNEVKSQILSLRKKFTEV